MIDLACARLGYEDKDQDRVVVRPIGEGYLLGVADGATMDSGRAAAEWAESFLLRTSETSLRGLYEALRAELEASQRHDSGSKTTLTCGILKERRDGGLTFDFFAIGDSPVWRVVHTAGAKYPYQRYIVHAGPYPGETGKLYSTISLGESRIEGAVSFGSVDIEFGELLVVCSDGVPEREVFVRDLALESAGRTTLLQTLFSRTRFTDEKLLAVVKDYSARDVLVDDVAIVVARCIAEPRFFEGESQVAVEASPVAAEHELTALTVEDLSATSAETELGATTDAGESGSAGISGKEASRTGGLRKGEIPFHKGTKLLLIGTEHTAKVESRYNVTFNGKRHQLKKLTCQLLKVTKLEADAPRYWIAMQDE